MTLPLSLVKVSARPPFSSLAIDYRLLFGNSKSGWTRPNLPGFTSSIIQPQPEEKWRRTS